MKIKTKIWIDKFIGQLICISIDIFCLFKIRRDQTSASKKICIILLSEMGSLTVTSPMIQLLKRKYHENNIHILTLKKNDEIIKIMELVPESNIITIDDSSINQLITSFYNAMRKMKLKAVDTIIDCELFSRISSICSYFSGAKTRVGFHAHTQEGLYRGNHINKPVLYTPYLHISRQFVNLADAIDSVDVPKNKNMPDKSIIEIPQTMVSQKEIAILKQRVESYFPGFQERPIVIINPGGGLLPIRAWPAENYAVVAKSLIDSGFSVAVTGIGSDDTISQEITSFCKSIYCVNMVDFTRSIKELIILFTLSKLLITNDGGPGHFSSLTSLPSIILYGPETPILYGSLNPNAVNITAGISCSPCLTAYNHRNSPCNGNNVCLKAIEPELVINQAHKILSTL